MLLNKVLKEYIQKEVKKQMNKTSHSKIDHRPPQHCLHVLARDTGWQGSPGTVYTGHVPHEAPNETQKRQKQLGVSVKLQYQKHKLQRKFIFLYSMTLLSVT